MTDPRLQAKVLDGLAEAHIGLGNFKEASEAIDRMKSIGEEINSTTTVAAAHMHEARCLPPLEALPRAEKALTMSEEVRSPEMIWRAHQVLGRILKEKGDLTNATSHYHQARATVESIAEKLSDPKVRQRYLNKPEHKELFAECERLRADSRA